MTPITVAGAARKIVQAAESQLGVPYVYGGESPGQGFDCSGLTQWCCGQAGVAIPRTSSAQFGGSGPRVAGGVQPGDLVFFFGGELTGPRPGHVGIVTRPGEMIDAPYTGVDVRYDSYSPTVTVGPLDYYGATRPALLVPQPPPPKPLGDETMQLLTCDDGPKGVGARYSLSGDEAAYIGDVPTLRALEAAGNAEGIWTVASPVSWAWLKQYVTDVSGSP